MVVSMRSARASIRFLIRGGVPYVDAHGLKIPRDPSSMQLDVDEVLERLEVVGLPDETVKIAIEAHSKGGRRKAIFEIQIDRRGTEYLATIFPDLRQLMDAVDFDAATAPAADESKN